MNKCINHKILCIFQVHFLEEMWEKTVGGKRRLKSYAVPTLFANHVCKIERDEMKALILESRRRGNNDGYQQDVSVVLRSILPEENDIVTDEDTESEEGNAFLCN